ncbi:hypothetical protein [Cognatilysobacter terrigena]|uniref:hypothetical protein n=1 Tax=Cognatilysobacter terrigena TaxID=2488749 RepID=UPI001061F439|nr:hypothetical protein [Lysobacter terrigena]
MKKTLITLAAAALLLSGSAFAEVKIKGKNEQSTNVQGAVLNAAVGAGSRAKQNISSNKGNVSIGGDNKQSTTVQGAVLNAAVGAGTKAEQNVSSNDGD